MADMGGSAGQPEDRTEKVWAIDTTQSYIERMNSGVLQHSGVAQVNNDVYFKRVQALQVMHIQNSPREL